MKNYPNIPSGLQLSNVKSWLVMAIVALAAAGLYSLPPVVLRGPFFADKLPVELIFSTALVVHVDLSVVVWFLSIGGMLWGFLYKEQFASAYKAAFIAAFTGTLFIIAAPFVGEPHPLKNNYIPVLQNPVFFIGLSLFGAGIFLQAVLTLLNFKAARENFFNFGIYSSALITIIAAICFFIASKQAILPMEEDLTHYYEEIFWGGGHVLQFTFVALVLLAWLWLANLSGLKQVLPNKAIAALFAINLLIALPSPLFYLTENPVGMFADQMRHGLGIAAFFIGGAIILSLFYKKEQTGNPHVILACLFFSIVLFGYGGTLGHMISGVNVTIPAHYHGSIVAVTLAFMGLAYYLLPQFGYGEIRGKLANSQPYIYAIGQIMHITGLAWMGGYGALRKSANSTHTIDTVAGKALFFSGGSLAILGGLIFVIIALKSLCRKRA